MFQKVLIPKFSKQATTRLKNFLRNIHIYCYQKELINLLHGKIGLEIGGPSSIFCENGILPVYSIIKNLDGCNFAHKTVWQGEIKKRAGKNYNYYKNSPLGHQYICEITNLQPIESGKYDFVLCSHVLEHLANPLKAVEEIIRVLKDDGIAVVVLPDLRYTFDHNRQITPFTHLIEDYENKTGEDDLTHLDEILNLHDLSMDLPAGTPQRFLKRSLLNYENRCLHQHVFNFKTMKELAMFFELNILFSSGG